MARGLRQGPAFSLGGLDISPGKSAKVLVALSVLATSIFAWLPSLHPYLVLSERTFSAGLPSALATNLLVALPTSFMGLGLILALLAYFLWEQIRFAWAVNRAGFIVAIAVGVLGLVLLNTVLNGFGYGLAVEVLLFIWLGTAVERQWGANRTLLFVGIICAVANTVGGLLIWVWPAGLDGMPSHGGGPLVDALMTVWCLMAGRRRFAILNIEARKLVWVLVAINVLDFIFVGRISGLMGLTAIGTAVLLISGLWRPRYLLDRLRLFFIDRRVAARRGRMRVVKDKRKFH